MEEALPVSRWLGADSGDGSAWLGAFQPGRVTAVILLEGGVQVGLGESGLKTVSPNSLVWANTVTRTPQSWHLLPGGRHEALVLTYPVEWVE
eukprot:gene48517-59416_t